MTELILAWFNLQLIKICLWQVTLSPPTSRCVQNTPWLKKDLRVPSGRCQAHTAVLDISGNIPRIWDIATISQGPSSAGPGWLGQLNLGAGWWDYCLFLFLCQHCFISEPNMALFFIPRVKFKKLTRLFISLKVCSPFLKVILSLKLTFLNHSTSFNHCAVVYRTQIVIWWMGRTIFRRLMNQNKVWGSSNLHFYDR